MENLYCYMKKRRSEKSKEDILVCPVCKKEFKITSETMYIALGGFTCSWKCFLDDVKSREVAPKEYPKKKTNVVSFDTKENKPIQAFTKEQRQQLEKDIKEANKLIAKLRKDGLLPTETKQPKKSEPVELW